MSEEVLLSELREGRLTLTLNRPQVHNALTGELIERLAEQVRRAEQDDAVRLIVLAGSGRSFCSGADLAWMSRVVAGDGPAATAVVSP